MLSVVRARAAQAARASAAGLAALGGARAMSSVPAEDKVAPFFDDDKPSYPIVEGVNDDGLPASAKARAFASGDRAAYPRFYPRVPRKDLGSYADEDFQERLGEEMETFLYVPEDVPLYNLWDVMPEAYRPQGPTLDALRAAETELGAKARPYEALRLAGIATQAEVEELRKLDEEFDRELGELGAEAAPGTSGAKKIYRWTQTVVLAHGTSNTHPKSRKAACEVYLRDLQEERGLSEEGTKLIALLAGPRYDDTTGKLRIVADSFKSVQENRADILRILDALVAEAKKL